MIYSDDGEIGIEYLSESIWLDYQGSSKTYIDILLVNKSQGQISSVNIIYPNCFIRTKYSKDKLVFKETGKFLNLTPTYKDDGNNINLTYELSGYKKYQGDDNNLILEKPDPDNYGKTIKYKGIFDANSSEDILKIPDNFTDIQLDIQSRIHMTILLYVFKTIMKREEKRWVRLFFNPDMVATYHPKFLKKWSLFLIDSLKYSYWVMGPIDVKKTFQERLALRISVVKKKIAENGMNKTLKMELDGTNKLLKRIIGKIDSLGVTNTNDFMLHIFPGKLRTLLSVYAYGKIVPNGALPSFLPEDDRLKSNASWSRRVYDWSTKNIDSLENENSFNIYFLAEVPNRYLKTLILITVLYVVGMVGLNGLISLIEVIQLFAHASFFNKVDRTLRVIEKFLFIENPWIAFVTGIIILPLIVYVYNKWIRRAVKHIKKIVNS